MAEMELPDPKEIKEIREKKFTRTVALVTAVFAVVLAVASLSANRAMKEMLLAQQEASDQWAYYQAKSIRESLYKSRKMMLENQLDLLSKDLSAESAEKVEASIKALADQESQYANEKKEIREEAEKLEKERDINRSRDPYLEYSEVVLQIAIVMASVPKSSSRLEACTSALQKFRTFHGSRVS